MTMPPKTEPPLTPLAQVTAALGAPVESFVLGCTVPASEAWAGFVNAGMPDIKTRTIGNDEHLIAAYVNCLTAEEFPRDLAKKVVELGGEVPLRANDAAVQLSAASRMVHSALVLHLRPYAWSDRSALVLLRLALELCGRAAFIAWGVADECERVSNGPQMKPSHFIKALVRPVLSAHPKASSPKIVYEWLSHYGHMGYSRLEESYNAPKNFHEKAYATIAYVSWALAVVTEKVTGVPRLAKWPEVMPARLPW